MSKIRITDSLGATGLFVSPLRAEVVDATEPPAPPVRNPQFTASALAVVQGTPVTLSWSDTDGATALYLNGKGVNGPRGAVSVLPNVTTTYTLQVVYPETEILRSLTVEVTPAPPPVSIVVKLGVNVIANGQDARNAANLKCPYIAVTFNDGLAVALKNEYPGLMVSHRANLYGGGLPSDSHFREKHGYALTAGMIVLGLNEQDQIGAGPIEIQKRAQFDATWFQRCKDIGAIYVGGGFSMGVPDITKADIRAAMRDNYAPLVQQGMWFNQHCYSGNDGSGIPIRDRLWVNKPNTVTFDGHTATMQQWDWLETRWHCYYWYCGFDPAGKGRIISDETGWDLLGTGGMVSLHATDEDVQRWGKRFVELSSAPFVVDGKEYPSHMVGAAIFQAGDDQKWAGFEVRQFFSALHNAGVWI